MARGCVECGTQLAEDDDACPKCGRDAVEGDRRASDGGAPRDFVWVCTECGRPHPKNSPPCSRCGNVVLEKQRPDYSDVENVQSAGYLDVVEPRYAIGYLVIGAVVALVLLSAGGVVSVPYLGGGPAVPDAPGSASTYGNLSLPAVEEAYVEAINDRRRVEGVAAVSTGPTVQRMAAYYNKRLVDANYGDARNPTADELDRFDPACGDTIYLQPDVARSVPTAEGSIGDLTNETALAEALRPVRFEGTGPTVLSGQFDTVGVDVHVAPDETLYVMVLMC